MAGPTTLRLVADQFPHLSVRESDHVRVGASLNDEVPELSRGVDGAFNDRHAGRAVVGLVPTDRDSPTNAPFHGPAVLVHMFEWGGYAPLE